MEIRAAVADAILRYKFAVCSQTEIPLTFQKGGTLLTANGVWINIINIEPSYAKPAYEV